MSADNAEALARAMLEAGRPFEWTLIVLSAYFGRETALVAIEAAQTPYDTLEESQA